MKNENDQATYNNEFRDLQVRLYDMSMGQFNGVSLFASTANPESDGSEAAAVFGISGKQDRALDHAMSIYTSENGSTGQR